MGSIAGDLRFRYKGGMRHSTPFPVLMGIPLPIEYVSDMESKAKYILLCGNQSGFIQLAKDKFDDTFSCILVYTEEPAAYWAVDFVKKMKEDLGLPVLAVGDSSPLAVKSFSHFVAGGCDIKWLGLRPSELESIGLSEGCMLVMRKADLKLAQHLLEEDIVKEKPEWVKELKIMVNTQRKVEIEALFSIACSFFPRDYLPRKMTQQDWI
ncbi:DNA topoisomerase 6 subunit A-like [Prunus yedoensis var. nudiflora]|uniref:DNA topoisomerase 6 subunit A-like n=1 Tax=Prunus yedoensis var. nudiflora TaxID=2094558 RepID=A0A314Y905_PRUYE|nr:DNA topoisomerase 6 subunit A-like [Prunus yedoensis var. nudiflora]